MRPVTPYITMPSRRMAMHYSKLRAGTAIRASYRYVKQPRGGCPVAKKVGSGRATGESFGETHRAYTLATTAHRRRLLSQLDTRCMRLFHHGFRSCRNRQGIQHWDTSGDDCD